MNLLKSRVSLHGASDDHFVIHAPACIVQYEKVKEKLETTENQIEELRQRLDDALGAEELVEQLTEKNLHLTEQLEEINSSNEELEALKELADELEENHVETEKQLQAEIGKIYCLSCIPNLISLGY